MIFNQIETHYQSILKENQVVALWIIIMGTAGTGKLYLIKAIRQLLRSMLRNRSELSVLVIIPTGVAAYNINGTTIYSTLLILIFNCNLFDIDNNNLKQLQDWLEKVIYLIINEKSMVRWRMLRLINLRLKQAFSNQSNELFRGWSILIFRDFGQLPPVFDLSMFSNDASCDINSNNNIVVYKHLLEAYKFDVVQW